MEFWKREGKKIAYFVAAFLGLYYLPLGHGRLAHSFVEALQLVKWYAREHVLLCLIPAFFIAGAISVFISQASVIKYLGARANKFLAYGVASVSGSILAVCSCTVLPLFAGIYRMGAGLGPATAFLYSGPAINVLAVILTARVLGLKLGVARAVGAILFSVVIGLGMQLIFRAEKNPAAAGPAETPEPQTGRPLWQNAVYFALLVGILVFANWAPGAGPGIWRGLYALKWWLTGGFALGLAAVLVLWLGVKFWQVLLISLPPVLLSWLWPQQPLAAFVAAVVGLSVLTSLQPGEAGEWFRSTWDFAKQILPLLLLGVLIAGVLLGRPGEEGLIPGQWVSALVGGNSLGSNFFAAFAGAFMYFATLTEVPILQGLIGHGMGQGPALALLLAGPALSLPNMLVIRSVMGTKKTAVYVMLVVVMATLSGYLFGALF